MKVLLTLLGAVTGAVLVLLARAIIERVRYRRFKRDLPATWWWYHWLSMWGFIGLTEVVTRTNLPDITVDHEALDAIGASIGSVARRRSNEWTPETPLWDDLEGNWMESDVQFRARIKAGN